MAIKVRKLRHWKQRFVKGAAFVWNKPTVYAGTRYNPGEPLPEDLAAQPTKLRRFWESRMIALADFEEPKNMTSEGQLVEAAQEEMAQEEAPKKKKSTPGINEPVHIDGLPEGIVVRKKARGFAIETGTDVKRVQSKAELDAFLETLKGDEDESWLED